ncbi:MAG: hypothetical protein WCF90_05265 [Methanomicrobiales archaeon]
MKKRVEKRELLWNSAILGTAAAALLANLLGFLFESASVVPLSSTSRSC